MSFPAPLIPLGCLLVAAAVPAAEIGMRSDAETPVHAPAGVVCGPPVESPRITGLDPGTEKEFKEALLKYWIAPPERQAGWRFPAKWEKLLEQNEYAVRVIAWEAYRLLPQHEPLLQAYEQRRVSQGDRTHEYTVRTVGTRPDGGWPLLVTLLPEPEGGAPATVPTWDPLGRSGPSPSGHLAVQIQLPRGDFQAGGASLQPWADAVVRQFLLFGSVDPARVHVRRVTPEGRMIEMAAWMHNPTPRKLQWKTSLVRGTDYYWLQAPQGVPAGREITATCESNRLRITAPQMPSLRVFLDGRLINFRAPVEVSLNGQRQWIRFQPRLAVFLETLAERGHPDLAFSVRWDPWAGSGPLVETGLR